MSSKHQKIALALSGASGVPYFLRLLERLRRHPGLELHLVASEGGRRVLAEESNLKWPLPDTEDLVTHANKNIGASIASGSFDLAALVVIPCSMHTVSAISMGLADNLIQRCAAVQLKESRRLILVPRETPLSLINLRAMTMVKEAGAVLLPASPGFYHKPETIEDLLDTVVDRVLDHIDIEDLHIKRWNP